MSVTPRLPYIMFPLSVKSSAIYVPYPAWSDLIGLLIRSYRRELFHAHRFLMASFESGVACVEKREQKKGVEGQPELFYAVYRSCSSLLY